MLNKIKDLILKLLGLSPIIFGMCLGYFLYAPLKIAISLIIDLIKLVIKL